MPSSFNFDMSDLTDPGSLMRAVGRNHVNITPTGTAPPLRTTKSQEEVPQTSLTTWAYSDIMQGAASTKHIGASYDVFNQTSSNQLVGILNTEGNIDTLLGPNAQFAPYDVVERGQYGPANGTSTIDGLVSGATGANGMGTAGSGAKTEQGFNGPVEVVTVQGITVAKSISGAVDKLLTAAAGAGVVLSGWGWRSHQRQIELRTINGCPDVWHASPKRCKTPTAIPGTSKHETGLAIDFTENGKTLSRSTRGFNWLMQNAATYGLKNLPSEPWHWSTDGK